MELQKLPLVLSHTSLNHYITCPKRFYHLYIAKDAGEKKTYEQNRGITVHEALRRRLQLREPLPKEYAQYEGACLDFERIEGTRHVEWKLGVDAHGRACDYSAPAVCFRGVADLCIHTESAAFINDWKNGKTWEDPLELRTLAFLVKARLPALKGVTGAYYWLRTGQMGPFHPVVGDTARTWTDLVKWSVSIATRVNNNDWPADENPLCPWCSCSKAQCQHRKDPPNK